MDNMGMAFTPLAYSTRLLRRSSVQFLQRRFTAHVTTKMSLSSTEIRETFLKFYEDKGHHRMKSASLIPEDPTIMLTIAGMVPFKPIFLGQMEPEVPRATSSQKCIRTNDIENVGVTKRHHTFFEMLGNFSFGDYFKKEAMQWSWELLTEVYKFPKERLAVSVFRDDEESYAFWRDVMKVPESRIQRLGEEDNFWASGPTGPCGPCTEIYYDFHPESTEPIDLEDDERFIELYNLVFMQYNRDVDGTLTPLKKRNIDTGMGLERIAQVLQKVDNNYETDLIRPIIDKAASIASVDYDAADERARTQLKVIGDHTRAVMHMVADGIRASNVGRGYILRRLIRRVVRQGRQLGIEGPFLAEVLEVARKLAAEAGFKNVVERKESIEQELVREESRFLTTLDRGESRLGEVLQSAKEEGVVSGADAFELYDTFGFPLELTEEAALEAGLTVDSEGFEKNMEAQRQRARSARGELDLTASTIYSELAQRTGGTEFLGYAGTSAPNCRVSAIVSLDTKEEVKEAEEGANVAVIFSRTPFYAEGGGQVGDVGTMKSEEGVLNVTDVRREAGAWVHFGTVEVGRIAAGDEMFGQVDGDRRRKIRGHHTATHLLQAALKKVLPKEDISQAGSLVDDGRLRFDFNCSRALADDELSEIEQIVNRWIEEEHDSVASSMSLDEAVKLGAVAMFGEKYDKNEVRVVDIPGVSMELCGGTHVSNTTDIGLFKIMGESGIAAGVRRIEAVCGTAVMPYLSVRDDTIKELSSLLKVRTEELVPRVSSLQEELKLRQKEVSALKAQVAVAGSAALVNSAEQLNGFSFLAAKLDSDCDADALKVAAERLAQKLGAEKSAVVLASSSGNGKVAFVATAGKDAVSKGVHSGKLIGTIAKMCKGGGGGKPTFAQAGGKDESKLNEAIEAARAQLREALTA